MRRLLFREWFVVVCFLCFALSLFFVETFSSRCFLEPFKPVKRRNIQVLVEGEVERPGVYEVEAGISVKSILEKAGPKTTADLRLIYLKKNLLNSCRLVVSEKKCKKEKKKKGASSSIASCYMLFNVREISSNV